ncbi:hypothetical protein TNCT_11931 [Trichonephila clavata]|uniref:Uncharacterized protein n=1 Tax=Trichonephila clavata TaxID=2740835 RepID=A0A8X6F6Z7_TRICU|nr:hypothetical protein TNCT_11931 [Trichonephila clavata]
MEKEKANDYFRIEKPYKSHTHFRVPFPAAPRVENCFSVITENTRRVAPSSSPESKHLRSGNLQDNQLKRHLVFSMLPLAFHNLWSILRNYETF